MASASAQELQALRVASAQDLASAHLQALRAALPEELAGVPDELLTTPKGLRQLLDLLGVQHAQLADGALAAALRSAPALDTTETDYQALIEALLTRMAASAASDPCPPRVLPVPCGGSEAAAASAAPARAPPAGHTAPPRTFSDFYMPLLHLLLDPRTPYPQALAMRAELERRPRLYEPVLAVVEAARRVPGLRAALRHDLQAAADAALARSRRLLQAAVAAQRGGLGRLLT